MKAGKWHDQQLTLDRLQERRRRTVAEKWRTAREVAAALRGLGAEQVLVFGSLARGTAREDSDIDLAVVMPTALSPPERAIALYRALKPLPEAVDLVVLTPEEIAGPRRSRLVDEILREGVPLDAP